MTFLVLKRCVYNIGDRKSLGVYSNGDEVQLMKNQLKTLTEWISVFVHYGIAFFNGSDQSHQVATRNNNTPRYPLLRVFYTTLCTPCMRKLLLLRWKDFFKFQLKLFKFLNLKKS